MTKYAVIGQYTGDDKAAPWVGPVRSTIRSAADAYYILACKNLGYDYYAIPSDATHQNLFDVKCALSRGESPVKFNCGDELLYTVEVPE